MKYDNQLRYAVKVIEEFKGEMPLHAWLKIFFRQHPQMGSGDRRKLAGMVFGFYRLGHFSKGMPMRERILTGIFFCHSTPDALLGYFKPEWNERISFSIPEKLLMLDIPATLHDIFPWKKELSDGIDFEKFCASFLLQPDLFIRLRPGYLQTVPEKLSRAKLSFRPLSPSCVALPNSTKIDSLLTIDKEAVIQDYNSQRIGDFLKEDAFATAPLVAWDCCAASGGKSIMLYDLYPAVQLTVSDIRESILVNLRNRFRNAGIKKYTAVVTDLSSSQSRSNALVKSPYDLIIADLPCTGSGTWSRTPDALYFFDEKEIRRYSSLQKNILSRVVPSLKKGGILLYCTCSVFKEENEDIVAFMLDSYDLKLEKMELLKGYDDRADSMFVARFRRQQKSPEVGKVGKSGK